MRICVLIKYIILNNFRELKQIIITKFNIRDNLAEKIVQSYYLFGFMFGILIAYFSMYSKLAQVYFLGINYPIFNKCYSFLSSICCSFC